ncbi:unnamed protein product [Victoria cruziana]
MRKRRLTRIGRSSSSTPRAIGEASSASCPKKVLPPSIGSSAALSNTNPHVIVAAAKVEEREKEMKKKARGRISQPAGENLHQTVRKRKSCRLESAFIFTKGPRRSLQQGGSRLLALCWAPDTKWPSGFCL